MYQPQNSTQYPQNTVIGGQEQFQLQNFTQQPQFLQILDSISLDFYLSNLSENATKNEVFDYFKLFGFITDLNIAKFHDGRLRGHGKLSIVLNIEYFAQKKFQGNFGQNDNFQSNFNEQNLIKQFLSIKHCLGKRRIRVLKYVDQKEGHDSNEEELISRRICVLNIPPGNEFSDEKLQNIFEYFFGGVFGAYIRQCKKPKSGFKKYKRPGTINNGGYGFVTFMEKESVSEALKISRLILRRSDWSDDGYIGLGVCNPYASTQNNKQDRMKLLRRKNEFFCLNIKKFVAKKIKRDKGKTIDKFGFIKNSDACIGDKVKAKNSHSCQIDYGKVEKISQKIENFQRKTSAGTYELAKKIQSKVVLAQRLIKNNDELQQNQSQGLFKQVRPQKDKMTAHKISQMNQKNFSQKIPKLEFGSLASTALKTDLISETTMRIEQNHVASQIRLNRPILSRNYGPSLSDNPLIYERKDRDQFLGNFRKWENQGNFMNFEYQKDFEKIDFQRNFGKSYPKRDFGFEGNCENFYRSSVYGGGQNTF